MSLLKHYGIHFSQLHPLAFLRIIHFAFSCAALAGEPSVPLFRRFYRLQSDDNCFTFEKRKENISLPCYSFMSTSTYPKEWKNRFIFVSPSLLSEPLSITDPVAAIKDGVPHFSSVENALWRHMYEHSTHAFNFPEGILAMGGRSLFYPTRPMAFFDGREMSLWSLLQANVRGVSYVVEGVVNHEMGDVLGGEAPNAEGLHVEAVLGDGLLPLRGLPLKG
ncbi:hypothetical protein Hdeb2414_s0008g00269861 [Helianthus debilis subsp. tardiflorus]